MARLNDHRCAHGLFTQVFFQDALLYAVHQLVAEEPDDRGVHPAVHQPEGVRRADYAVELGQLLEEAVHDFDPRQALELLPERPAQRRLRRDQYQAQLLHNRPPPAVTPASRLPGNA